MRIWKTWLTAAALGLTLAGCGEPDDQQSASDPSRDQVSPTPQPQRGMTSVPEERR